MRGYNNRYDEGLYTQTPGGDRTADMVRDYKNRYDEGYTNIYGEGLYTNRYGAEL
jgi:hypothetical protein